MVGVTGADSGWEVKVKNDALPGVTRGFLKRRMENNRDCDEQTWFH